MIGLGRDRYDLTRLKRTQGFAVVGATSTPLVGPHPGRRAIIISAPSGGGGGGGGVTLAQDGAIAQGAATVTSATNALTYTAPDANRILTSASVYPNPAGAFLQLTLTRAATTVALSNFTNVALAWTGEIVLASGDVVAWLILTGAGGTAGDFSINVANQVSSGGGGGGSARMTVGFGDKVTLDQGINVNPGASSLYLVDEWIGCAIQEGISAIMSSGSATIGWLDIFE